MAIVCNGNVPFLPAVNAPLVPFLPDLHQQHLHLFRRPAVYPGEECHGEGLHAFHVIQVGPLKGDVNMVGLRG